MRCIAVVEAERPGLDSVIIWGRDNQLLAVAYLDGKVMMTRPLAVRTLDEAISEVQANFQINAGQLTRITDWTDMTQPEPIASGRTRW